MQLALDDDDHQDGGNGASGKGAKNFTLVVTREKFEEINADLFANVMLPLHAVSRPCFAAASRGCFAWLL